MTPLQKSLKTSEIMKELSRIAGINHSGLLFEQRLQIETNRQHLLRKLKELREK